MNTGVIGKISSRGGRSSSCCYDSGSRSSSSDISSSCSSKSSCCYNSSSKSSRVGFVAVL